MEQLPQDDDEFLVGGGEHGSRKVLEGGRMPRIAVSAFGCIALLASGFALGHRHEALRGASLVAVVEKTILTVANYNEVFDHVTSSMTTADTAALLQKIEAGGGALTSPTSNTDEISMYDWYNAGGRTTADKNAALQHMHSALMAKLLPAAAPAPPAPKTGAGCSYVSNFASFGTYYSHATSGLQWEEIVRIDKHIRGLGPYPSPSTEVTCLRNWYINTASDLEKGHFENSAATHMYANGLHGR